MRLQRVLPVLIMVAVGVGIGTTTPIAAKGGKPPLSEAARAAMASIRARLPETRGHVLATVGHVTPAAPLASTADPHMLSLQIGRTPSENSQEASDLRWDPVNNQLLVPATTTFDANPEQGAYAGLLFTLAKKTHYSVLCKGTSDSKVALKWRLITDTQETTLNGPGQMEDGTLALITGALDDKEGYVDLRFSFASAVTINECWLFSMTDTK